MLTGPEVVGDKCRENVERTGERRKFMMFCRSYVTLHTSSSSTSHPLSPQEDSGVCGCRLVAGGSDCHLLF